MVINQVNSGPDVTHASVGVVKAGQWSVQGQSRKSHNGGNQCVIGQYPAVKGSFSLGQLLLLRLHLNIHGIEGMS